jgi:hypothetical protein
MQPMVIKGGRNRLNGSFALIRKAGSNVRNHDGTLRQVADLYVRSRGGVNAMLCTAPVAYGRRYSNRP